MNGKKIIIIILSGILLLCIAVACLLLFKGEPKGSASFAAAENGILAGDKSLAAKNTSALKKLINKAAKYENTEIIFEGGTYYFDTSSFGISCKGIKNLSFIGNDTLIINTSYDNSKSGEYFSSNLMCIEDCENITVKNISFDYADYTSINGTVIKSDKNGIAVAIGEEFLSGEYHNAISGGEKVYAINELSGDNKTFLKDIYLENPIEIALDKDNKTVTLSGNNSGIAVGSTVIMRFELGSKIPAFMLKGVRGFNMQNVNIYSCPSALVYSTEDSSDFYFNNLSVAPRENSGMLFSSNVDGVHLKNFSGKVILENCRFEGMGDDVFNANSYAAKVVSSSGNQIQIESPAKDKGASLPESWAKSGDIINVYTASWKKVGEITVEKYSSGKITASTDFTVPNGAYLENTRFLPEITIKNSSLNLSRARAFMLRSKNITVDNCVIENTALPAIITSADIKYWYEMSPSENVTISNCSFNNCNNAAYTSGGVITVKYTDNDLQMYVPKIHKNISILNNNFNFVKTDAIYAAGVDGLTISGNTTDADNLAVKTENCESVITD